MPTTIYPFNNTPTVVHVTKLPEISQGFLSFGFNPGKKGTNPIAHINVKFVVDTPTDKQVKICTYDSYYEIVTEGLIIEDDIYGCCQQAVYAMKRFLQFDEIGRSIPEEYLHCPGKEAFADDLIVLAKALNALGGRREGFPIPKP